MRVFLTTTIFAISLSGTSFANEVATAFTTKHPSAVTFCEDLTNSTVTYDSCLEKLKAIAGEHQSIRTQIDSSKTTINGLDRQIAAAEEKIAIALGNRIVPEYEIYDRRMAPKTPTVTIAGSSIQILQSDDLIAREQLGRYTNNSQSVVGAKKPPR